MTKKAIDWDKHIDNLINITKAIEPSKLTILTGSNASGKSVIRKQLTYYMTDKLKKGDKPCVAALSFMSRAGLNYYSGINFLRDNDWAATSKNSLDLARNLLRTEDRYLVLDEPEIGMGEEMQLAFARYVNSQKASVIKNSYGLLVITHSRIIVNELDNDAFFCTDKIYQTKEDWLNREIIPTDLDEFDENAEALFVAIRDRQNKKKNAEK